MTPAERAAAEAMREDAAMACVGLRARAEIAATKARLAGDSEMHAEAMAEAVACGQCIDTIRALPLPAAERWAPPEDRAEGFACLARLGGVWHHVRWLVNATREGPSWVSAADDWLCCPEEFAPLPPEPRP